MISRLVPLQHWLSVICLGVLLTSVAQGCRESTPANASARHLRTLLDSDARQHFDMHGNACAALRELLLNPRVSSLEISTTLERGQVSDAAKDTLYYALGFMGQLSSVEWLSEKLDSEEQRWIRRSWFRGWIAKHRAEYELAGPAQVDARWTSFLERLIDGESSTDARVALLRQLARATAIDPHVVDERFSRVAGNQELSPGNAIAVMSHLHERGRTFEEGRLQELVRQCSQTGPRDVTVSANLLQYSARLPHHAVLPWLIDTLDTTIAPSERSAVQRSLVQLTFQSGLEDSASWKRWYRSRRDELRAYWIEEQLKLIDQAAENDCPRAERMIAELLRFGAVDQEMLAYLERWIEHRLLSDEVARCVAVLARDHFLPPHDLERARKLAKQLLMDSSSRIGTGIRSLLRQAGLLPADKPDWKEVVDYANSRV